MRSMNRRRAPRAAACAARARPAVSRFVGHVEVVDELRLRRELADLANRRLDGAVRIDPHVVGRHQAAGASLVVGDELAQLVGRLRRPSRRAARLAALREARAEQIGRVVGIHLFDDVGGALGAEIVDDRALRLGVEMLERVGGGFVVERSDDARGVAGREVADDLGEVRGMQPRQPVFC